MSSRKAPARTKSRLFSTFQFYELENRLVPASVLPKQGLVDLGDSYTSSDYSTSIQRFTDRIALGLDVESESSTLARLTAPDGVLAGFLVAQQLESGLAILANSAPASDSANVQYVDLESRMGSLSGQSGVRWSAPVFHDDANADIVVGSGTGSGSTVAGYLGTTLIAGPQPSSIFAFDAFDEFVGGVYVG